MVKNSTPKSAVTLIELLIVLVILTALTGIAVQSLEPVADQARYEATERTMQRVVSSIADPDPFRQLDGSATVSGFVADMGRLPSESQVQGVDDLTELYAQASLQSFRLYQAKDTFTEYRASNGNYVSLWCGWRGPYVQQSQLSQNGDIRNAFGEQFEIRTLADESKALFAQPLASSVTVPIPEPIDLTFASFGDITVSLTFDGATPDPIDVKIVYFAVNLAGVVELIDQDGVPAVDDNMASIPGQYEFVGIPSGIRALWVDLDPANATSSPVAKQIVYLNVLPGRSQTFSRTFDVP